ncbi:MAG TPA: hypothetical protein P5256_15210, partial [Beijerinckiaceae bacterium]|nr:hypothetical protein [Beijerinckiaceae bacterium]
RCLGKAAQARDFPPLDPAIPSLTKANRMDGPNYYEFFAGGGMARAGLGPGWRCLLANDFDASGARPNEM